MVFYVVKGQFKFDAVSFWFCCAACLSEKHFFWFFANVITVLSTKIVDQQRHFVGLAVKWITVIYLFLPIILTLTCPDIALYSVHSIVLSKVYFKSCCLITKEALEPLGFSFFISKELTFFKNLL